MTRLDHNYRTASAADVSAELYEMLFYIEEKMEYSLDGNQSIINETRKAIQHFIDRGAEFLGCGTTRICFAYGDDQVVKIPFTFNGYNASSREVATSETFKNNPTDAYIPVADCEFFQIERVNMWLLSMERLRKFPNRLQRKMLPEWTQSVDCAQVGYNSRGKLVAFDL